MEIPAILQQILAGIQAAINAAPQIEGIVASAKALFVSLFNGGVITVAQQQAAHAYVDAGAAMWQANLIPPQWQVQPDPVAAPAASGVASTPAPVTTSPTVVQVAPKTF